MTEDTRIYYVWLALAFGPASKLAVKLLDAVGSPEAVYDGKSSDLLSYGGLSEKEIEQAKALLKTRTLEDAMQTIETCSGMGIEILTPESDAYPNALRYLADRPLTLYLRGTMPDCNYNMTSSCMGSGVGKPEVESQLYPLPAEQP